MPDPVMAVEDIPVVLTSEISAQLNSVSTATLTHQLHMHGLRSTFLTGLKPTHPELRLLGRARTLRYVALREDVKDLMINGRTAQKHVVETVQPGDVVVMEARGIPDAGTIGDIFTTRVKALGGVGVITDGALRETARDLRRRPTDVQTEHSWLDLRPPPHAVQRRRLDYMRRRVRAAR